MSGITQKEINQVNTIKGFLLDGHHYISYIGKRLASDFRTNLSSSIDCVTKDLAEKDQQLAAAKAEIAEYREVIECLIIEHGIHDSYDGGLLPDNVQSETIRAAINLLAKHRMVSDD